MPFSSAYSVSGPFDFLPLCAELYVLQEMANKFHSLDLPREPFAFLLRAFFDTDSETSVEQKVKKRKGLCCTLS